MLELTASVLSVPSLSVAHVVSSPWESPLSVGAKNVIMPVVSVVMEQGAQRLEISHILLELATVRTVASSAAMWESVPRTIDRDVRPDILDGPRS